MQDRFNFRVWDGRTYNHNLNRFYLDSDGCLYEASHSGEDIYLQSSSYIIEQCTGLKDKNNKLIYENDILKSDDGEESYMIRVKYFEDEAKYYIAYYVDNGDWEYNLDELEMQDLYQFEIIGNIYENPELMGVDK